MAVSCLILCIFLADSSSQLVVLGWWLRTRSRGARLAGRSLPRTILCSIRLVPGSPGHPKHRLIMWHVFPHQLCTSIPTILMF